MAWDAPMPFRRRFIRMRQTESFSGRLRMDPRLGKDTAPFAQDRITRFALAGILPRKRAELTRKFCERRWRQELAPAQRQFARGICPYDLRLCHTSRGCQYHLCRLYRRFSLCEPRRRGELAAARTAAVQALWSTSNVGTVAHGAKLRFKA